MNDGRYPDLLNSLGAGTTPAAPWLTWNACVMYGQCSDNVLQQGEVSRAAMLVLDAPILMASATVHAPCRFPGRSSIPVNARTKGSCNCRRCGHPCCFSAGRGPPVSGQEPVKFERQTRVGVYFLGWYVECLCTRTETDQTLNNCLNAGDHHTSLWDCTIKRGVSMG